MVLDQDTGDMVTLEEFTERTKRRVISGLSNNGHMRVAENVKPFAANQKRKVGGEEGEGEMQKKTRF